MLTLPSRFRLVVQGDMLPWANDEHTALLDTEFGTHGTKVWYVDLTQHPPTSRKVASVSPSPASAVRMPSNRLKTLVCTGNEIDEIS